MRILSLVGVVASVVLGLIACGGSDDTGSSSEEVQSQPTAAEVEALFYAVDENCGGNDNGRISKFDVAKFDANAVMKDLQARDKDASGSDCSQQRKYSTDRESAVRLFEEHLSSKDEYTKECLAENLTQAQRSLVKKLAADSKNLGVFSSIYAEGGDNPEGCHYYNFLIYRADGTLMDFTFNYTD